MRTRIVSGITLTLLLLGMLTLTFNIQLARSEPRTWTVDDDKPADFSSIQEAINAASEGDTILVSEGVYSEWDIEINKSLTILADGTVTVDGLQRFYVFKVTANNVTLSGFIVTNSSFCGIFVSSQLNLIKNNKVVRNSQTGIIIFDSHNNVIENNSLSQNHQGIELGHSHYNVVKENSITLNHAGILLAYSHENLIESNIIEHNMPYDGIWLQSSSRNNIVTRNIVFSNENSIALSHAGRNFIYDNNFVSSGNQIYMWEQTISCVWDNGYPSGGNYWSDYEERYPDAQELDSSGIWDTPYVIDENNQDNYPLMEPWTPLPRTIGELKTEIEELGSEGEIDNQGIIKSLLAKLNVAQKLVDKGKVDEAEMVLNGFIKQVQELSGIHITVEAADILIQSAEYIISKL